MICMGREVSFVLRNGQKLKAKRLRDGMLYDSSGKHWPSCSVLITPFENGTKEVDEGKSYFGRNALVCEGRVDLPSKSLDGWKNLGELKEVYYDRAGTKHPGYFRHEFNKPRGILRLIWPLKRAGRMPAVLYSRDGMFRIELPEGCIIDDRGYVVP